MTRSADIVKQLRLHARVGCDNPNIYHKAVNEIEWLRGQVKQLETIINGDWPKNYKVDQDRVSLPAYVVGLEKQNDKLKAERDALRELLRCVSTNLKKTMSKSMQELQARTIDAAMKEKP